MIRKSKRISLPLMARLRRLPAYLFDPGVSIFRKLMIVLGVAYVVMPLDALPDIIPVLGWLDDIGVIGIVLGVLFKDLDNYALDNPVRKMMK